MRTRFLPLALLLFAEAAYAVPTTFTHQGFLVDADGVPLEGPHTIKFTLYNAPSSGQVVWTESKTLTLEAGLFVATLGDDTPITATLVDTESLHLALTVDGGAEIPQRVAVASVPFAMWADNATDATNLAGGTVDATEIAVNGAQVLGADRAFTGSFDFERIGALPDGLDDGDDDTLADVSCGNGQVLVYDGSAWTCQDTNDHLHDAEAVSSGQLDVARLPVGNTNSHVAAGNHGHNTDAISSGTLGIARLPVGSTSEHVAAGDHRHDASSFTSGKFAAAQLPIGTAANELAVGNHGHDAAAITGGTIAYARLPVGTTANTVKAGNAPDSNIMGALSCTTGQLAKYNGSASRWECADDEASGGGSMLGSWDFDEDSGTSFADTSGIGANLTLSGGGVLAGAGGHAGNALSYSSSRGVFAASGNTIPDAPEISAELWLQPDGVLNANRTILEKAGQYRVRQVNNLIEWTVTAVNGACTITHSVPVAADSWHHVGAWYNGQNVAIEINGNTQVAACAKGPIVENAGSVFTVGGKLTGSSWSEAYQGEIDEVRLRPFAAAGSGYGTNGWASTLGNVPVYRWNTFRTYHNGAGGWFLGNNAELTGGQNPSAWTDGNALGNSISANKNVQRALFTNKGYGGSNALIYTNLHNYYSSTDGEVIVALFRIRNTTGSNITWTPYFYYTSYGSWNEYASATLNGNNVWSTGGDCTSSGCGANFGMTIPANRTSTVIFTSTAGAPWCWYDCPHFYKRWTIMGFYNNSLALPSGLVYVDDLDIATGGYEQ